MSSPTPQQLAGFEKETKYRDDTETRFTRERFVREFLTFAGGVAYVSAGSGSGRVGGMYNENNGSSKAVPIETAEGSPQMGASIHGYFSEFHTTLRRFFRKEKAAMREVTGASVSVGALATTQWGTNIYGGETVLRVFENPRLVFYKPGGSDLLVPLEADTPAWSEMTDFVAQLTEQKEALDNGYGQPIGWIG